MRAFILVLLIAVGMVSVPVLAGPKTVGVGYDEMKAFMSGLGFEQKLGTPVDGLDNVVGNAKGALSQIIGGSPGVVAVSLTIMAAGADDQTTAANIRRMDLLLGKLFPGWSGGFDWLQAALQKNGDSITRDGKTLRVAIVPSIGAVVLSIKPAA